MNTLDQALATLADRYEAEGATPENRIRLVLNKGIVKERKRLTTMEGYIKRYEEKYGTCYVITQAGASSFYAVPPASYIRAIEHSREALRKKHGPLYEQEAP